MYLNIVFDFFNSINSIISYIGTLLDFLIHIINVVIQLMYIFFTNMPSWISGGFLLVFSLGIIILLIKLVR